MFTGHKRCVWLLLTVVAAGCGDWYGLEVTDAATAELRVCGFPAGQLDTSQVGPPAYLTSIGRIRLGQRLKLELRGDIGRATSITWEVEPGGLRTTTHSRFTDVRRTSAVLEGLSLSRDDNDYDFAGVRVVFRDGSEGGAAISVCSGSGWEPAHHIVVTP